MPNATLRAFPAVRLICCTESAPRNKEKTKFKKDKWNPAGKKRKNIGLHAQSRFCTQRRIILAAADFASFQAASRTCSSPLIRRRDRQWWEKDPRSLVSMLNSWRPAPQWWTTAIKTAHYKENTDIKCQCALLNRENTIYAPIKPYLPKNVALCFFLWWFLSLWHLSDELVIDLGDYFW